MQANHIISLGTINYIISLVSYWYIIYWDKYGIFFSLYFNSPDREMYTKCYKLIHWEIKSTYFMVLSCIFKGFCNDKCLVHTLWEFLITKIIRRGDNSYSNISFPQFHIFHMLTYIIKHCVLITQFSLSTIVCTWCMGLHISSHTYLCMKSHI